jgi:hypothetical protein
LLAAAPHSVHELSARVRLPEKEVVPHPEHLAGALRRLRVRVPRSTPARPPERLLR